MSPSELAADRADTNTHIAWEDLVLYAMQVLPEQEVETAARHVQGCTPCRQELELVCISLTALACTAAQEKPSPAARDRLLAQVALEKKTVHSSKPKSTAAPAVLPEPVHRPLADFGRGRGTTLLAELEPSVSRHPALERWIGWAVAAVFAIVSVILYLDRRALGDSLANQAGEIQRLNARAGQSHQLLDALTDPQATRAILAPRAVARTVVKGPRGDITYDPDKGALVFLASNLDPLQVYKTYQLWLLPKDGLPPVPAGTFHPDQHGNASVVMPKIPKGTPTKGFQVTIEDAGGTDKPAGPIVLTTS